MGYERLGAWTECREQLDVVLVYYCWPVGVWTELLLDGEDAVSDCLSGHSMWTGVP